MEVRDESLRPGFGLSTTTYIVIASMVGVGILTTSGYIIKDTGSHTLMLALWLVGGIVALCGALTIAELAAAMPYAGGEYVFVREAYGRVWAFLYGWVSLVIGFSAPAAMVAHAAGRYLINPWIPGDAPHAAAGTRLLAALFIVVLTVVHLRGHVLSSWVHNTTTIVKLLALVAIVVAAFALGHGRVQPIASDVPATGVPWSAMGISLVYVMFAYTGWNAATYLAGEVRDARRNLPRALLIGCGAVIVLYLLLNVVYVCALPVEEIAHMSYDRVEPIAALAVDRLLGAWVAVPFSVGIGLGLLATLSAFILVGPRVYYAMACDGLLPAAVGRLNRRTGTPNAAILCQAACSLVLLFSGTFKDLLTYAGVGLSLSSFFVILAVFVLRIRRPDMDRPFRTPLYPVVPILFLACTAWMVVFAFICQPVGSSVSLGTMAAGIPIYYVWRMTAKRCEQGTND